MWLQVKVQQVDLIAELKRRQASPQVREGKDGAIEDIITGTAGSSPSGCLSPPRLFTVSSSAPDLRNQPYRRAEGRRSARWRAGQQLQVSSDISL